MATDSSETTEKICYYYNTPSGCWRRDFCSYQHVRDETADLRPICKFYGTSKKCWYGKHCYFKHIKPDVKKEQCSTQNKDIKLNEDLSGKEDEEEAVENITNDQKPADDSKHNEVFSTDSEALSDKNSLGNPGSERNKTLDQLRAEHTEITCGECGLTFKDGEKGISAYSAIEKHYFEMLGRADHQHMKIFHDNEGFLNEQALCGACGRVFKQPEDLMRHLGSKYNIKQEKYDHKEYFWEIVHQFVVRDTDHETCDGSMILDYLALLI